MNPFKSARLAKGYRKHDFWMAGPKSPKFSVKRAIKVAATMSLAAHDSRELLSNAADTCLLFAYLQWRIQRTVLEYVVLAMLSKRYLAPLICYFVQ